MDKRKLWYKANRAGWRFFVKHPALLNGLKKVQPNKPPKFLAPLGDKGIVLPDSKLIQVEEEAPGQESMVLPSDVFEYFIEKSSYRAIMNFCACRDAEKCENHSSDLGCVFLGEGARDLHPDFCRSATKDEVREILHRYQEEDLMPVIGRLKIDAMLFDIKDHKKFLTICGCCTCCCVTRIMPHVSEEMNSLFKRMPGIEVQVNDNCVGCGKCLDVCLYEGIKLNGENAETNGMCRACGRCTRVCPNDSIKIKITDDTFVQQTIDMMTPLVDVT